MSIQPQQQQIPIVTPTPMTIPAAVTGAANWSALIGPLVIQALAIVCITIITLFDGTGVSATSVIAWLSVLAAGNVVGGGIVSGIHGVVAGRVQQTSIRAAASTATATVSALASSNGATSS